VTAELVRDDARGRGAGRTLLERCAAFGADLLVMGAFGHSRAAELVLGGATRTILAETSLPTLLSH
jgi:nucleotide-binding universal stress UspA family protein